MDHFSEMEDFFLPAKNGDIIAYRKLYESFIQEGLTMFKNLCFNQLLYSMYVDDVFLMLSELFMKVMDLYRKSYGKFTSYAMVAIKRAIVRYFTRDIQSLEETPLSLDSRMEDGTTLEEQIAADDYRSEASAIASKDSVYRIASKSKSKNKLESQVNRVLLYRISGYSYTEICKKMRISEGQLRFLISKVNDDEELMNLKIDLK